MIPRAGHDGTALETGFMAEAHNMQSRRSSNDA